MPIQAIDTANLLTESLTKTKPKTEEAGDSFGNILSEALNGAQSAAKADEASAAELLLGDSNQLHNVVLDTEKAQITLDLAVQIRNKVVDAYNEIMRMQV